MTAMKVKELIKLLQEVDPELPVYRYNGIGEFMQVTVEHAGHWMNYEMLMQSKNDPSYVAAVNDSAWKNHKEQFGEPFKAVRFW